LFSAVCLLKEAGESTHLHLTTDDVGLHAALVDATEHAEIALLTPVLVPAVGEEPVVGAVVNTVAHQLDGVVASKAAADVVVDTGGVHKEVLVDSDGCLARAVHGKLGHQILLTFDRVGTVALVLVLVPGLAVLAGAVASGGGAVAAGAGVGAARDVVIAGLEAVGRALLGHDTGLDPVVVGRIGAATVAATSARASEHILRGKDDIVAQLDAGTIADGVHSTKGPAGTAPGLITDHVHGLAVGVVVTRIIGLRSLQMLLLAVGHTLKASVEGLGISDTKKLGLDILKAHPGHRAGERGTPEVGLAVHATNKVHRAHTASNCSTGNCAKHKQNSLHLKQRENNKREISTQKTRKKNQSLKKIVKINSKFFLLYII